MKKMVLPVANDNGSEDDRLGKTTDSGKHWEILDLPIRPTYDRFFISSDKIVVGGENRVLYISVDQGNTWDSIATPVAVNKDIRNLYAVNDEIWFLDGVTSMYKTEDSGLTWNEIDIPFSSFELMHFNSVSEGFMIMSHYAYEGGDFPKFKRNSAYQTSDGGESWTETQIFEGCYLTGPQHFPNNQRGYSINNKVYRFMKK